MIVQVCIPTSNHDDERIEKIYDEISDILHQEERGQAMANFNSIMEEGSTNKVVEAFVLQYLVNRLVDTRIMDLKTNSTNHK